MRPRLLRGLRSAALAAAALAAGCAGPRPAVESVRVAPGAWPGARLVTVALRNEGDGEGEVLLTVTLRERPGGAVVGRERRALDLEPREALRVTLEVHVGGPGDVTAEAEASYPPE